MGYFVKKCQSLSYKADYTPNEILKGTKELFENEIYGRDEMQIVQTLETINVNTDDINVFQYFKDLITKNFTKVVGRKNKIFLF